MKRTPLGKGRATPLKRSELKKGGSTLSSNKGLSANKGLDRGDSQLKRTSFDKSNAQPIAKKSAKRKVQSPEEIECRKIVSTRSGGICEICGKRPATDMAHRIAVSQSGKWEPSNLLHACRFCHSNNHDHPQNSFDHGWHLRSGSKSLECKVLLAISPSESQWMLLDNTGKKFPVVED